METRISRVISTIYNKPGASVSKGELMLDAPFARDFLKWRTGGEQPMPLSDTDLLMECCRSLELDLVCIQCGETVDNASGLSKNLKDIGPISRGGFFVFWVVNGAFQSAMNRRGMMDLLMGIARSPDDVCNELRQRSDQVIGRMKQGIDAGAHGIIIADDIAYHRGTYMSPDFVGRHLLPIWQDQVNAAATLGVPVFFHSDGNLKAVLPSIIAAGFDGLQCLDPSAGMDLPSIKRTHGKDLCLMGNVDPSLLCRSDGPGDTGSRDDPLARAVHDLIASADAEGGLIFGTSSGLHAGLSPERVDFMHRLASDLAYRRQGGNRNP